MTSQKTKIKFANIDSIEDLQMEQRRLKLRIRIQETELRKRVKQLPGELFYAGANAVVPSFLSGKVTSSVLNTGKSLVNSLFAKNGHDDTKSKVVSGLKNVGLFSALRFAFKTFIAKR
jgi:hypothetical protein